MNAVYVHHLSYALGSDAADINSSAAAGLTVSSSELLQGAGFGKHWLAAPDESVLDLAIRAVEPIRDALEPLDAIIWATCIPENASIGSRAAFEESRDVKPLMDFPASHLQSHLKATDAIVVGVVQQACTSMLGSLRLAHGLLATEPDFENVLCVTSDRFPPGAVYEQSYNLISDGAACCVVSPRPQGFRLIACHQITNGGVAQATDEETASSYFTGMNRLVTETLAKADLGVADLTWIVPQNINTKTWLILARLLGIEHERVFLDPIADIGHCIGSDNIINLKRLDDSGRLGKGDLVLCVMAGYGLNWQAVLLEKQ